eukprot:g39321.t1
MAADDLLDVDAGGIVGKDKGNHIAVAGGKRGGEGRSAGNGSDLIEGPADNGAGESLIEEEGEHFGSFLIKVGLIGTYVMETEERGQCNGVFTGSR